MSANNNAENASFPIDDYIEIAEDINIANQVHGKQMDKLFHEVVAKAKEYRNHCRRSDTQIESLKKAIVEQWKEIRRLRNKFDETSKKLKLAEASAKTYEIKYNRLYDKLKTIVLETATDSGDNDRNNDNAWFTEILLLYLKFCKGNEINDTNIHEIEVEIEIGCIVCCMDSDICLVFVCEWDKRIQLLYRRTDKRTKEQRNKRENMIFLQASHSTFVHNGEYTRT